MKGILLLLLCSFCLLLGAQPFPDYCVYLVQGKVMHKTKGKKPEQLVQHAFLLLGDSITVQDKAIIQLIGRGGKFLVVNQPGKYGIQGLEDAVKSVTHPSLSKAYFSLVYEEICDPHHTSLAQIKSNTAGGVYGGVARGFACKIYPVNGVKTAADSIHFIWHRQNPGCRLLIYNSGHRLIYDGPVTDSQQTVQAKIFTDTGQRYTWKIQGPGGKCAEEQEYLFYVGFTKEQQSQLATITASQTGASPVATLDLIGKLDALGYVDHAKERYAGLIAANPGNGPLLTGYLAFLYKYGFDGEAVATWDEQSKKK